MNLQKFFLINLHFVLNLVGNLLLVILVWSCFLSQIEKDIFENLKDSTPINSNMSKEEWDALRGLADDRSIVINKADKGSRVVVWCRDDYIKEAENKLKDNTAYKDVNFKETILSDLVDKNNKFFKRLRCRKCLTEKELKYFSY